MTSTIDKRVVEMAFENDKFEKGIGTSLDSIDKLKKGLNFDGTHKSFAGITAAAQGVNLNSIAEGVQNISNRFSAMGIIAITTLVNIANAAFQAGVRIIKALTIEPIMTGLNEYETKLNAVQTILANTQKEGTNLEQVTKALGDLNEYSDKTIYNFQQMARNVGTFTAAGVKLDVAVSAIKGIANLAAVSGSNADQASTAMYQLSQALSTGSLKLMDWNSVVNAGMGGQVFQDALKETARLHGVAIDQIIEDEGSFRDSLQKGWATSEILTETLAKFTGDLNEDQLRTMGYSEEQIASIIKLGQTANDAATKVKTFTQLFTTLKEAAQSGWAQTWEIIIGDFNEAKVFLTSLNDQFGAIIGASADARNAVLQGWKDLGGRTALLAALQNTIEGIGSVIKPISEALREIFPPVTAQQLFNITKGLKELTERFKLSGPAADKLKRIFKGIFALLDIGVMVISAVVKAFFGLTGSLSSPLDSLTDFIARIADFIVKLRDSLKSTDAFTKMIENIGKFLSPVVATIKRFFSSLSDGVASLKGIKLDGLTSFFDKLKVKFEPLSKLLALTGKVFGLIGALLTKIAPTVLALGSAIADGIGEFVDKLMTSLGDFDPEKVFQIVNGGLLAGVLLAVRKFIGKGSEAFSGIKGIFDGIRGSLEAWQMSLKADVLMKIAVALGILTLSVIALSMIDSKKLTKALAAMTTMFVQLGVSLVAFQNITSITNPLKVTAMAISLVAIATAMLILAGAVSILGKMNSKQLVKGMLAIITLIGVLKIASATLAGSSAGMITGALALIVFSVAIRSLGKAVEKLGSMDPDTLARGLIGVGVLVTELALFMKVTDLSGMGLIKSVGILILAGAIVVLSLAVIKMGEIDPDKIAQGLFAMGVIFAELSAFIALTSGAPGLILVAGGVAILSIAMLLMTSALERLGNMSWDQIAKGLVAMAGAFVIIGAAAYLIPPTLIITAAGLLIMAGALVILADAMTTMGDMSWDEIGRGITVLAGSLLILVVALSSMTGTLAGSAALLIAAAALAILAPALKTMGSMSLGEIGLSLLALAGAFVVLGLAGSILTPVIPSLLGLGAAMLLIGIAVAGLGIGLLAFSAGLSALAISGAAGAAALVVVITSIVGLLPMIVKQVGKALLTLIEVLVAGAPTLLEGIITLLNILLDGLIEITPKLVDTIMKILDSLLTAIAKKTPALVAAGYKIIISFLEGAKANIGKVVDLAIDIIAAYLNGIAARIPDIIDSGWNLVISWIDGMTAAVDEHMPELMDSVRELGLAIVKGLLTGLVEGNSDIKAGIKELGKILIDGFKESLGIHSASTVFIALTLDIIKGLVDGLRNNATRVVSEMINLGGKVVDALKGKYASMVLAGKDLVIGFAQGIKDNISTAIRNAGELARAVLETITNIFDSRSPSRKMEEQGKYADLGLAGGIVKYAGVVVKATKDLSNQTISGFGSIVSGLSDTVSSDLEFSPTIRPVIDLTEIKRGSSQIEGILGGKKLNLSLAASNLSSISTTPGQTGSDGVNNLQQTGRVPSVSFTQNNYSPKSLSRVEIYRLTKNQLNQAKDMVGA